MCILLDNGGGKLCVEGNTICVYYIICIRIVTLEGGLCVAYRCKGFDKVFAKAYLNYLRKGQVGNTVQPVLMTDRIKIFGQNVREAAEADR